MKHWVIRLLSVTGGMIGSFFLCIIIYWFTPLGIYHSAGIVVVGLILIILFRYIWRNVAE